MRTLADFKRRVKVGAKMIARYPNGLELPPREVTIKQTNSFALKTFKTDGTFANSWMDYPKATMIEFPNPDTATIFWNTRDGGREECLTYEFVIEGYKPFPK